MNTAEKRKAIQKPKQEEPTDFVVTLHTSNGSPIRRFVDCEIKEQKPGMIMFIGRLDNPGSTRALRVWSGDYFVERA